MSAIGALDDSWYFVALNSGITVAIDLLALSRWVQAANNYMLALDVTGDSVLVQGESTSLAAQIAVLEPRDLPGLVQDFRPQGSVPSGKALNRELRRPEHPHYSQVQEPAWNSARRADHRPEGGARP